MKRPNKELTTFIKSQLAIGSHIEKIRSDLHTGEWTDADIDEAIAYVESKKKRAPQRKHPLRFSAMVILFVLAIGMGVIGYIYRQGPSSTGLSQPQPIMFPDLSPRVTPVVETTTTPIIKTVDEFAEARTAFEQEFTGATFVRASRHDTGVVISAVITDEFGSSSTKDLIFVKQGEVWKFSDYMTLATSTPLVEIPLFIVKEITVMPAPPLVNDSKTDFEIQIVNEGVLPFEKGVAFEVLFADRAPVRIVYPKKLEPGEVFSASYRPYAQTGKTFADAPGTYTLKINYEGATVYEKSFELYD